MIQQGQVFELETPGSWAYRYRLGGRDSQRIQCGGFSSRQAAAEGLQRALGRVRHQQARGDTPTLTELVDVYLAQHEAEPETLEKLAYLLGKATRAFGQQPISQLEPLEIAIWRMTIPPGHRFEATQALRQTLRRAVKWGLIDRNPAIEGVENPQRRRTEQRPFESWYEIRQLAFTALRAVPALAERAGKLAAALVPLVQALSRLSDSLDAVTCCSGVHWFDQQRFFSELRRVLRPDGWVGLYDHYFLGEMVDVPAFADWTRDALERFPLPDRNAMVGDPRAATPDGFEKVGEEFFGDDIEMTHEGFADYQLTISNFVAAAERGMSREELRGWLLESTAPLFAGASTRVLRFLGSITCLRPA